MSPLVQRFEETIYTVLSVLAVFSLGYLCFDIFLGLAYYFSPEKTSSPYLGEMDNHMKPIFGWASEAVHSWVLFFICILVVVIWAIVLQKRK